MKGIAAFLALTLVLVAMGTWLFDVAFQGEAAHRAIRTSAGIAVVTQLVTFAIVRLTMRTNVIAGWGLGMLLRLLTVAIYATVIVKPYGLPLAAALLSLATFFFISTLIEPVLLKL